MVKMEELQGWGGSPRSVTLFFLRGRRGEEGGSLCDAFMISK